MWLLNYYSQQSLTMTTLKTRHRRRMKTTIGLLGLRDGGYNGWKIISTLSRSWQDADLARLFWETAIHRGSLFTPARFWLIMSVAYFGPEYFYR